MKFFAVLLLVFVSFEAVAVKPLHRLMVDPTGVTRDIFYENKNGYAVAEGDIILAHIPKSQDLVSASITPNVGGIRWPNGVIPFVLADNLPSQNVEYCRQAMALWHDKTGVQFIEITPDNKEQYPNYVYIQPAEGTTCSSEVGRKGGEQTINLAPRCTTIITAHELGHTIGLWHEQSRQDRDQYIKIIWDNIEKDHQFNFDQHLTDGMDYGPYNYDSVMHYSAYGFSKNGEKTIITLQDGVTIGQRDHLSEGEIIAVKSMLANN